MLSKSTYTRGINCHRALWLYKNKRTEQTINESTQRVFDRGTDVGILATQYFPEGVMAVEGDYPTKESVEYTQQLLANGIETIYEATFIYDNTLVAVDILSKVDGKWCIFEVKSTNSTKPQHIKDVAVQYYVVKGSGLDVQDTCIMHFNRDYIKRGEINVKELFTYDSVFDQVIELQSGIKENIPILQQVIEGEEPQIAMGDHCENPYHCDFYDYCSEIVKTEESTEAELSSNPEVQQNELQNFIDRLKYPLYYFDFETITPGVPIFDESRPYQQIPFQYSLHWQNEPDGKVFHTYYLAENNLNIDPRKALIEQMIKDTKSAKTILVYYIAFERSRMNEMKRDFPDYSEEIDNIIEKLDDLIIPFKKKFYRTETMEGSSSIKRVLPSLCPEFSYSDLEIGDGMTASNSFLDLYYCNDTELIEETRKSLLDYCHLDTLAMVKILEVLKKG